MKIAGKAYKGKVTVNVPDFYIQGIYEPPVPGAGKVPGEKVRLPNTPPFILDLDDLFPHAELKDTATVTRSMAMYPFVVEFQVYVRKADIEYAVERNNGAPILSMLQSIAQVERLEPPGEARATARGPLFVGTTTRIYAADQDAMKRWPPSYVNVDVGRDVNIDITLVEIHNE